MSDEYYVSFYYATLVNGKDEDEAYENAEREFNEKWNISRSIDDVMNVKIQRRTGDDQADQQEHERRINRAMEKGEL